MRDVVFLSRGWGARGGGISTFNQDLSTALAALAGTSGRVACVVPSAAPVERERALRESGVTLLSLDQVPGSDSFRLPLAKEVVARLGEAGIRNPAVVGHDLHTGPVALAVRDELNQGRPGASTGIVIVHTDPFAYKAFEGGHDQKGPDKREQQGQLLDRADVIFAVGPRLARSARDLVRSSPRAVHELIPGLASIQPIEVAPARFQAITFGRLDPTADRVKQGRLALASFADVLGRNARAFGDDPVFSLIGVDPGDTGDEAELARRQAGRVVAVYGLPYDDNRAGLGRQLAEHSVALMLSLHEGFGLVGWEVVAAGVPLILSRNTGLHDFLKGHPALGEAALGRVHVVDIAGGGKDGFDPGDLSRIGEKLLLIARDREAAKEAALALRRMCLDAGLTWSATARAFATTCDLDPPAAPAPSAPAERARPTGSPSLLDPVLLFIKERDALDSQLSLANLTATVGTLARRVSLAFQAEAPPGLETARVLVVDESDFTRVDGWLERLGRPAAPALLLTNFGKATESGIRERVARNLTEYAAVDVSPPGAPPEEMFDRAAGLLRAMRFKGQPLLWILDDELARFGRSGVWGQLVASLRAKVRRPFCCIASHVPPAELNRPGVFQAWQQEIIAPLLAASAPLVVVSDNSFGPSRSFGEALCAAVASALPGGRYFVASEKNRPIAPISNARSFVLAGPTVGPSTIDEIAAALESASDPLQRVGDPGGATAPSDPADRLPGLLFADPAFAVCGPSLNVGLPSLRRQINELLLTLRPSDRARLKRALRRLLGLDGHVGSPAAGDDELASSLVSDVDAARRAEARAVWRELLSDALA